jgi:hypothetical protein
MHKILMAFLVFLFLGAGTAAEAEIQNSSLIPSVITLGNGVEVYLYRLPDGSTMTVAANVSKEILLGSSDEELALMGVPARPVFQTGVDEWLEMYSNTNLNKPEEMEIASGQSPQYATYLEAWGGYVAGTFGVVNTSYVAVKANFVVPSSTESCTANPDIVAGFWVGLGGYSSLSNDLVQQGIGWCSISPTNHWMPWTEFAMSQPPVAFCGYSSWYLNPGDVIYNNMSFQNSTDTAYFYMQDQTSGVSHSCSRSAPSGWTFNGNIAECISERSPGYPLADYGSVHFSNCQVELGSNSTWYPIGARSSVKQIITGNPSRGLIYQATSTLGADDKSFTMTFIRH